MLDDEPYILPGWDRTIVKKATLKLINARTHEEAVRTIVDSRAGKAPLAFQGPGAHARAGALIDAIKARHPKIAHFFHSDAGIRLMRRDSEIAEEVMLRLLRLGIVVFPNHDSFLAKARHEGEVREAMEAAWRSHFGSEIHILSMPYVQNVPHNPGEPVLVLVPIRSCQPDLFDRDGVRVDRDVLASWDRGVVPSPVRQVVERKRRALDLRQEDLAHRIGISRPQLTNALRGRFGLGSQAVERLKDFLLEEGR